MRLPLAAILTAAALCGQTAPSITVSAFRVNEAPRGPEVTAGLTNIFLQVNGSGFSMGGDLYPPSQVIWTTAPPLPATPATYVLDPIAVEFNQLVVAIPDALLATPVDVRIKVRDPFSGAESAEAAFKVNPLPAARPLPNGTVGIAYGPQSLITGGTAPFTVTATNPPLPVQTPAAVPGPPYISGTPATAGTFTFNATIADSWGQGLNNQSYTLIIAPAPSIAPAAMPRGTVGLAYNQAVSATGGNLPYTWFVTGGTLPPGIGFANGVFTGTPTAAGTYTVTVRMNEAAGGFATQTFTIPIDNPPVLTITTPSPLPAATAGVSYSQTFSATGSPPPYAWAITSGAVPGLAMSAAGLLTGIPTTAGTYNFTVRASTTTAATAPVTTTANFTLVVNPTNLTLNGLLPSGWLGDSYSAQLTATGATPPYTFSIVSGALPPGLALNATTGAIAGGPQQTGSFSFTARVADSSGQAVTRAFAINIQRRIPPLVINTSALDNAVLETAYSAGIEASGGEAPYTWRIGGLPPGLGADASAFITGTPTRTGTYTVVAEVNDSEGQTARKAFTLIVEPAALVITTGSPLTDAEKGQAYSASFTAKGGVSPYSWAVSGGALPPGLRVSGGGVLTGTPTAEGVFDFAVQATDSNRKIATKGFRLTVRPEPLKITTASPLTKATMGRAYSAGFSAAGGARPYQWSASGLPAGLSLDGAGNLTGTPAATGTTTFTVQVTDSKGAKDSRAFELTIDPEPLRITTASIGNGTIGESYSQSFAAEGGTAPYRWAAPAGWPGPGLSLSADGTLSGKPGEAGAFTVIVQVTDAARSNATRSFTFTIAAPTLAIATASPLPNGMVGSAYSHGFTATGATGAVTWSADAPAGLGMSAAGTLSGTPSSAGSFSFTVRATDAAGRTAQKNFDLTVGLPALPTPSFTGLPDISDPARQPAFQLGLTGSYPVPISGRLTLSFTPLSGGGDPAVQFSTGGTTVDFTIPANANLATFPVTNPAIQTGTVAGAITITASFNAGGLDITPAPAPRRVIRINPAPPVITEVRVARTATGFEVQVTGYATNREVLRGLFRFNPSASGGLVTTEQTITVDTTFNRWYQDAVSRPFGSRFTFVQPFNVQGETGAVASVTVTLANGVGNSNAVTANVP